MRRVADGVGGFDGRETQVGAPSLGKLTASCRAQIGAVAGCAIQGQLS